MKNQTNIELLQNTTKTFKEEFYRSSKIIMFKKEENPFDFDNLLKYFYILIRGRVKTYQINFKNNKEQTIFIYKKGDMFDVVSLLDNKPHEVVFEIIDDCEVLQIPIDKVRYWIDNNTTFNKIFFPYLAKTIRHTEELATEISIYDTKDRLINLLLDNINPNNHFRYKLLQNLSNSEIAKLLGTVRHVIERTIKQLKNDNIIQKNKKNIKILDFEKLLNKTSRLLIEDSSKY